MCSAQEVRQQGSDTRPSDKKRSEPEVSERETFAVCKYCATRESERKKCSSAAELLEFQSALEAHCAGSWRELIEKRTIIPMRSLSMFVAVPSLYPADLCLCLMSIKCCCCHSLYPLIGYQRCNQQGYLCHSAIHEGALIRDEWCRCLFLYYLSVACRAPNTFKTQRS